MPSWHQSQAVASDVADYLVSCKPEAGKSSSTCAYGGSFQQCQKQRSYDLGILSADQSGGVGAAGELEGGWVAATDNKKHRQTHENEKRNFSTVACQNNSVIQLQIYKSVLNKHIFPVVRLPEIGKKRKSTVYYQPDQKA